MEGRINRRVLVVSNYNNYAFDDSSSKKTAFTSIKKLVGFYRMDKKCQGAIARELKIGKGNCFYKGMFIYRMELL